jgi:outer membrane protein TolC
LVLFIAPGSAARAQDRLTLRQAIADAMVDNASIRESVAARTGADADVDAARASWLPHLTWSESWWRSNQPVFAFGSLLNARQFTSADFAIDRLNSPPDRTAFIHQVAVRQLLFDGGARTATQEIARRRRDGADARTAQTRLEIADAVTVAYGRVLSAQAGAARHRAAIAAAEEDLTRATRRREAGTATDADVLALAVQLARFRQSLIEAEGQVAIARAELNHLRGAPIDRVFVVEEPAPRSDESAELAPLFAEAGARPELARAAAAEAQARAARQQARAAWWPSVSAQASYELSGLTFADRASSWMAGADLRWELSLGGATSAGVRAAAAGLAAAEAATARVRSEIQLEIVRAVQQITAAKARAVVGRDAVAQSGERLRIVRNRYEAGVASINDLLGATAASLDADAERVAAWVDLLVARSALDRALGRAPAFRE